MEWQPIETAPRDGTFVLVCGPDGVDKAQFRDWSFEPAWTRDYTASYENDLADVTAPTHWMPLPPPPPNHTPSQ